MNGLKEKLQAEKLDAGRDENNSLEKIKDPYLKKVLDSGRPNIYRELEKINEIQNSIINYPKEESFIVQGCAGSGKTMILIQRFSRLLNQGESGQKIQLISPVNKLENYIYKFDYNAKIRDKRLYNIGDYLLYILNSYLENYKLENIYGDANFLDDKGINRKFLDRIYSQGIWESFKKNYEEHMYKYFDRSQVFKIRNIGLKKYRLRLDVNEIKNYDDYKKIRDYVVNLLEIHKNIVKKYGDTEAIEKNIIRLKNTLKNINKSYVDEAREKLISSFNEVSNVFKEEDIDFNFDYLTSTTNISRFLLDLESIIDKKIKVYIGQWEKNQTKLDEINLDIEETFKLVERLNESLAESMDKNKLGRDIRSRRNSNILKMQNLGENRRLIGRKIDGIKISVENLNLLIEKINSRDLCNYKDMENMNIVIRKQENSISSLIEEERGKILEIRNKSDNTLESLESEELDYIEEIYEHLSAIDLNKIYRNSFKNLLDKLKIEYGIENKIYYYNLVSYLYFLYLFYGSISEEKTYLIIDEGQDISHLEYNLLNSVLGENVIFNIYGDLNQKTINMGINYWKDIGFINKIFNINKNYRNTLEIVDYVNRRFKFGIIPLGVSGADVSLVGLNNLGKFKEYEPGQDQYGYREKIAIIYKELTNELKNILDHISRDIYILTPEEAKGTEFHKVYVYACEMTSNEEYIAYTRALEELYIIQ